MAEQASGKQCPRCEGTGEYEHEQMRYDCDDCHGSGSLLVADWEAEATNWRAIREARQRAIYGIDEREALLNAIAWAPVHDARDNERTQAHATAALAWAQIAAQLRDC